MSEPWYYSSAREIIAAVGAGHRTAGSVVIQSLVFSASSCVYLMKIFADDGEIDMLIDIAHAASKISDCNDWDYDKIFGIIRAAKPS